MPSGRNHRYYASMAWYGLGLSLGGLCSGAGPWQGPAIGGGLLLGLCLFALWRRYRG